MPGHAHLLLLAGVCCTYALAQCWQRFVSVTAAKRASVHGALLCDVEVTRQGP